MMILICSYERLDILDDAMDGSNAKTVYGSTRLCLCVGGEKLLWMYNVDERCMSSMPGGEMKHWRRNIAITNVGSLYCLTRHWSCPLKRFQWHYVDLPVWIEYQKKKNTEKIHNFGLRKDLYERIISFNSDFRDLLYRHLIFRLSSHWLLQIHIIITFILITTDLEPTLGPSS